MASVNGYRPPSCEDPSSHDSHSHSHSPLLGPLGFEGRETMSGAGIIGAGAGADGGGGSASISIMSGAQHGNSKSKQPALRPHRFYSDSVRSPQSFIESIVSYHV
jgi:hypothetical protein